MDTRKVIAICGDGHGCGKSTLARFIVDYCESKGKSADIISFADLIKDAASCFIGHRNVYEKKDEPCDYLNGATPRDLIIFLGEEIKKRFNPQIFVRKVIYDIDSSNIDVSVIDDLRFPVELAELRKAFKDNLYVVYIYTDRSRGESALCEGLIDLCDANINYTVQNNGFTTFGMLYDDAVNIVENIYDE